MNDADADAEAEDGFTAVGIESTKDADAALRECVFGAKSVFRVNADLLRTTFLDDDVLPRRKMFFQEGEVGEGRAFIELLWDDADTSRWLGDGIC
jgi:hypothetical protein